VYCSVVQRGAAWCSVVQRGAAWCSVWKDAFVLAAVLQVCCNVLKCVAV